MPNIVKPPLSVNSFSKLYGQFIAVDNVSFQVNQGEVFGFLGPNGAGKSTTIKAILDFIRPSKGNISVFGLDSVKHSVELKNKIGYLSSDIALYQSMTGQQIIKFLNSLGKRVDWEYVRFLENKLGAQLHRPIKSLSKGNKQKIGLIQALMHKPDLLILDEPTSGLDPLMKQVFYDIVKEFKAESKTVFLSSHDLGEVQKICDKAAFIRHGKLVAIEDIIESENINLHRYEITFAKKPLKTDYINIKNVVKINIQEKQLFITVKGSIEPLIIELAKRHPKVITEQETSLEELFMHYYRGNDES